MRSQNGAQKNSTFSGGEGAEKSDFRKRCAGEWNNGWLGRRRVRVAKGAEQVRMALRVVNREL